MRSRIMGGIIGVLVLVGAVSMVEAAVPPPAPTYGVHIEKTWISMKDGVRLDIRGFGASEGVPPDREYSAREQQDGEEVIAWLARQSWSARPPVNRSPSQAAPWP